MKTVHRYNASARFTFTAKDHDQETGYGYFGARYYDPDISALWLSVDPMADKYPGISPYAYCAWNPVKLVDPDGREIDDYFSPNGHFLGSDNSQTNNVRIINESTWNGLVKDGDGKIDHEIGNDVSWSFSEAIELGMTTLSQLNVYKYYNPTEYNISFLENEDDNSHIGGMLTAVGFYKQTTIRIDIYLKGNKNTKLCDNSDEIINSFIHEKDHADKAKKMGYYSYLKYQNTHRAELEESAVAAQKSHHSWNGTSEKYKKSVILYLESFYE